MGFGRNNGARRSAKARRRPSRPRRISQTYAGLVAGVSAAVLQILNECIFVAVEVNAAGDIKPEAAAAAHISEQTTTERICRRPRGIALTSRRQFIECLQISRRVGLFDDEIRKQCPGIGEGEARLDALRLCRLISCRNPLSPMLCCDCGKGKGIVSRLFVACICFLAVEPIRRKGRQPQRDHPFHDTIPPARNLPFWRFFVFAPAVAD